jgi:hypothetical protein
MFLLAHTIIFSRCRHRHAAHLCALVGLVSGHWRSGLCAQHLSSRLPLALAATEREKGKLFAVGKSIFSRWQAARAGASAACRTPDHLRVLGQILALQRVVLYLSSK